MSQEQPDDPLNSAMSAFQRGDLASAAGLLDGYLRQGGGRADAWTLDGVVLRRLGRLEEAAKAYRTAIAMDPEFADAHYNLANLLRDQGQPREAAHHYRVAIGRQPKRLDALIALSDVLNQLQEYEQAIHTCNYAAGIDASRPEIFNNLGNALDGGGQPDLALKAYRKAQEVDPSFAPAHYNQGLLLDRLGRAGESAAALATYCRAASGSVNGFIKLGDVLKRLGRHPEAAAAYERAVALQPEHAEAWNNLGVIYTEQGQWQAAIGAYGKAVALGAARPMIFSNLGNAHHALRQYEQARDAYQLGLERVPDCPGLLAELIHVRQKLCDWAGFEGLRESLPVAVASTDEEDVLPSPFIYLSLPFPVSVAEQLTVAENYAQRLTAGLAPVERAAAGGAGRVRIGYVSADFHNHATAHLMLGLFRRHDRRRFEVFAYSMGQDDGSHYRQRIAAECDAFIDIRGMSDEAAARRIAADGIGILVDLKGYTGEARPGIFARRPAPLQVSYLGYPGTMGGSFMDYIVADSIVIPPEHQPHYSEKPVYLPHSYQVNDGAQPIAPEAPSRAECGLPEQGFVFCCFNSPYKIEPGVFSVWMRLLAAVPGSVLWLFGGNPAAVANLKREAEGRGIAAERLVFAQQQPKDRHLARHRHADLFLDTLFYNAHTTASDALWAGVPVVTMPGETFACRVAASLLHAVGLPELVTASLADYEATALRLARDPQALDQLRARLAQNRLTMPLFDTDRFARNLDDAYGAIWRRHLAGEAPTALSVPDGQASAPESRP